MSMVILSDHDSVSRQWIGLPVCGVRSNLLASETIPVSLYLRQSTKNRWKLLSSYDHIYVGMLEEFRVPLNRGQAA